jgi:hypothetical protein
MHGDGQRPRHGATVGVFGAVERLEGDLGPEGDDDGIREEDVVALEVRHDVLDVARHLAPLVAEEFPARRALEPGDVGDGEEVGGGEAQ